MNKNTMNSQYQGWSVAAASPETRVDFLHKPYQHLALAICAFIGLEALLLRIEPLRQASLQMAGGFSWLIVLLVFGVVSRVAHSWATDAVTPGKAYAGLALYVVMEALIFLPLLTIATYYVGDSRLILKAGLYTAITFGGLTATVLMTKADLTFLGGILRVLFWAALATIVVSVLFGLSLGTWFAAAMAVFAGGAIAYETSNMVHHYRPGQHVAAALGLFSSVALLFWYVLQIVMSSRD